VLNSYDIGSVIGGWVDEIRGWHDLRDGYFC